MKLLSVLLTLSIATQSQASTSLTCVARLPSSLCAAGGIIVNITDTHLKLSHGDVLCEPFGHENQEVETAATYTKGPAQYPFGRHTKFSFKTYFGPGYLIYDKTAKVARLVLDAPYLSSLGSMGSAYNLNCEGVE